MPNQSCNHHTIPEPEPNKLPRVVIPTAGAGARARAGATAATAKTDQGLKESSSMSGKEARSDEVSGMERMKRQRVEMAGRVWIPEIWGQESLLKEWVDCSAFDKSLVPDGAVSARRALVEECQRAGSAHRQLTIENRC